MNEIDKTNLTDQIEFRLIEKNKIEIFLTEKLVKEINRGKD